MEIIRINQLSALLISVLLISLYSDISQAQSSASLSPLKTIIGEIRQLENISDPKCHSTASRLEDFLYGTPLSDSARFRKNELQKKLIHWLWQQAAKLATSDDRNTIGLDDIKQAIRNILSFKQLANGDWQITQNNHSLVIAETDKRQYSSIAYSLRALLSLQQEMMLSLDERLPAFEESTKEQAIETIKDFVDLYTLAALKLADQRARLRNLALVGEEDLAQIWSSLSNSPMMTKQLSSTESSSAAKTPTASSKQKRSDFNVIQQIIEQKIHSYSAYNHISNPIFVRNLQVYFARLPWPKDPQLGDQLKELFAQTLVYFASDLYLGAELIAIQKRHPFIRIDDVNEYARFFIPHSINEYEDALFFPNLPAEQRIAIESYDMDAFRDSGLHWRYLQFALETPDFAAELEPDPFAAELLVENIAQFGVLVLRTAGMIAKQQGHDRLHPDHINQGLELIQTRINAHPSQPVRSPDIALHSSTGTLTRTHDGTFFSNITDKTGIDLEHRTSDWLSRLLRSYLPSDESSTGNMTIPPAFGGSGIAADDVNGDDLPDLLVLSGLGNRLYLNDGNAGFTDVTAQAGLDWHRPQDNLPGEPRQPIIADFDNDGLQDLLITYVNDSHRLYKNIGNARFVDVTESANLGGSGLVGGPATVFDYDRDGLLDIYIAYFGDYIGGVLPTLRRRNNNGLPNKLFRNKGDMSFEDVTSGSGTDNTGWGQAVSHTDLDGDGWQDLIVGNDFGVNAYYRNQGNGIFKDISAQLGTNKPSYTMNIGIADLNSDHFPDIYISNIVTMNKDESYVLPNEQTVAKFNPNKLAHMRVIEANDLFLSNNGDATLQYVLSDRVGRGYSSTGWSWDADFFDFDNDGDDDLYVLNGMNEFAIYSNENPYYTDPHNNQKKNIYMPVAEKETNVFFVNKDGRLHNVSKESGVDFLGNSRSAVYLDFDRDGDLDIAVNNYHGPAQFFRNNSELLGGNWLSIKLIGDVSQNVNRDAIGARLIATTPDGSQVWREVHGSIGYLSAHPKEQHLGLGQHNNISLRVHWPNGKVSSFKNLVANNRYQIHQKNEKLERLPSPAKTD